MKKSLFPFRGFHYDIARGAYLRPEFFHQAIRHAARCGYTHFLPYLENMIRLPPMAKACPEVAYTLEDWRAFEQTARQSGIELVPHFNVIGHMEALCAAYPELAGREGRELDVDRKEVREWIESCLESFCSASQARHFLIGGDEWQTPDHLLERHRGRVGRLWAEHVNEAIGFLVRQGRTPLVWHDMLLHFPEALGVLSREAVVVFWFYDADADYLALETFRRHGFRTIMASGCLGHLNRRRAEAVQCAIEAGERHQVDGFIMTSWVATRWESQEATMEMTAEMLAGRGYPAETTALSAYTRAKRDGDASPVHAHLDAWTRYSEYRASLRAELTGDSGTERRIFEKYHYPCGPLYEAIGRAEATAPPRVAAPEAAEDRFALEIHEDPEAGPSLRFINRGETFVIYPRYGATLQDWHRDGQRLIAHTLPGFLALNRFAPGGYRSFTRALGFRPIWALGTHHNPCILWQHPYQWRRLERPGRAEIAVELTLSLAHCEIRYEVGIEDGKPGFAFTAHATPRQAGLYGAWSFNLPLALEDPERTRIRWDGMEKAVNDLEPGWLPGVQTMGLVTPGWKLEILQETGEAAGYFVDRGKSAITPDLHGAYRIREAGEPVTARWRFSIAPGAGCGGVSA